jgi:antitoxin component of RelBE/YafQ-DinJ toxin-antitoxin module
MAGASSAILKVEIIADAAKAAKGLKEAEGGFGKFGKAAKLSGAVAAAGAAVAVVAVAELTKQSLEAAKTQEDSFDHLNFVFGKNSDTVTQWAKDAAKNYGLTASEAADMVASVGAKLNGLGFPLDKTTSLSKTLAERAADMATAFGGTAADAMKAFGSAVDGKTKGLKAYGVSIAKADIKAQRLADGTAKLTGQAGKQAEAQAVLELALKDTAKTSGEYARQSGDLGAQQDRLNAEMTNLKATIGTALMPIFKSLAGFMLDSVIPALEDMWKWIGPKLTAAVSALGKFFTTVLLPALSTAWQFLVTYLTPVFKTLSSIVSTVLIPAFSGLAGLFTGTMPGAFAAVTSKLAPLVTALQGIWAFITGQLVPTLGGLVQTVATKLVPAIVTFAQTVATQLGPVIADLATFIVTKLIPAAINLWHWFATKILPILAGVARFVLGTFIPTLLKLYGMIITNLVPILRGVLTPIFKAIGQAIAKVSATVDKNRDKFAKLAPIVDGVGKAAKGLWDILNALLFPVLQKVFDLLKLLAPYLGQVVGLAFKGLGLIISGIIDVIADLAAGIGAVISAVQKLVGWISRIHVPKIHIPNPFGKSAPSGAAFTAPSAPVGVGRRAAGTSAASSASGGVVVNVSGALDPVAVARQIQQVLTRAALRNGTVSGVSVGWAATS